MATTGSHGAARMKSSTVRDSKESHEETRCHFSGRRSRIVFCPSAPSSCRPLPKHKAVISVQIGPPPLAPRYEHVPPPRRGYVWAPGHWEARHGRYAWTNGTWMRERKGYAYHAPEWQQRGGHWEYQAGGWDNDHDRGPSRYDHRPSNPYRS